MTKCTHCTTQPGVYDFRNTCCLVRFVLSVPVKELRAAWLHRWRRKYGNAVADEVEIEVLAEWAKRS